MATLTLEEFLPKARQLNPDYTDDEHIQAYEQRYGRSKPVQTVSPAPLTTFEQFLPKARALNPDYSDEEHYAAWHEKYGARGAREKDQGDFVRGGVTAFKQVPQTVRGLEAGAGAIGEKIAGKGGLFTALKEHGLKGYQEYAADIAKDSKPSDSVTEAYKMAKAGDAGALVDWLQYALGYGGGQALQMLATAGIGYAGGKLALQPAARTLAEKMIAKETARLSGKYAGEQLAKQAVSNVAGKIGQTAALAGAAVGMEGGEIYGGLVEKAAQEERSLTGEELAKATGATLGAGVLEFVGDKIGLDLVLGKSVASKLVSSRLGHAVGAGGLGLATESGTEFTQTLLEEFGKGNDPLAPESIKQAVDAAAMGGVGGASMGAAGGLLNRPQGRGEEPIVTERTPEEMGMGQPTAAQPETLAPAQIEGPIQPGEVRGGKVYAPGAVFEVSPLPDVSPVLKAGSLDEAIAHAVGVVQGATETGKARAAEFARMTAKAKNETDALLANAPEKRPAFDVPTLPGPEAQPATLLNQPSPIIPGQAFTPRPEPVDDPRARLAEERARMVAQREQQRMQQPVNPVSEPVAPTPAVEAADTPLPSQIDLAYPSSKQVRDLIHEKGFHLDTPVFREYLKLAVGKEKFSDLTPQELQRLAEKVQKIKAPQQPTPLQEAPPQVPLTPTEPKEKPYAPVTTIPEAQVPRSELTPEKNAEMLLRAEKAKVDMEIAGTERGGRFFQEQPGTGSTQEVTGLKSATADWYKDLTSGPSPAIRGDRKQSAREKIEVAIAKIINDQGADRGKAVEQVKAALLADTEFHKTEWGRDLNSIMQGEWPSWIEKPQGVTQATENAEEFQNVPQRTHQVTVEVPKTVKVPKSRTQKLAEQKQKMEATQPEPSPSNAPAMEPQSATASPERAPAPSTSEAAPKTEESFSLTAPEVSNPKAKDTGPEQLGIDVPPPTVGERPIIGREATLAEAPLFSKNAQTPDAEQTTLSEPLENPDNAPVIPKQDSGSSAQSIAPDITPAQSNSAQTPETAQSPTEIIADALRTAADKISGKQVPADEGPLPKQSQRKANEKIKRDGGLLNVNPARPQFDERNTERAEPTMAKFAQAFAEGAPIAGTAQKVIDSSQEFPKEMIEALSAKRYVRQLTEELGKVFNSMKRVLVQSDPETFSSVTFAALSPDSYYYGVNLRGPDQMILNPWTALHQVQQGVQEGFIGEEEVPEYLAGNLIKTLVHEFTHQQVTTTHQDERQPYFLAAEQRNRAILGSRLGMMQRQLMAVLTGGTNGTVEGIRADLKQQQAFWKEGDGLSAMDQSVSPKPTYARRRQGVSGEGASGRTGPPTYLRGGGESETLPLGESAGLRRSGAVTDSPAFKQEEYVAFDQGQIKSAIGNRGTFDPKDARIQFSRREKETGTIDPTETRDRLAAVKTSVRPYLLGALGLEQLSQVYGNDHAEVKAYNQATQAMEADFTEMSRESDKVARAWTDLKIPVADKMAQVMEDARFLNFDPDPRKNQEADSAKKQALVTRFQQLPDDAKAVYRMARDYYTNMAEQRFQALKERIERAGGTPENTRKLVDRLQLAYEKVRSKVYFPFSRFGENIVIAKQMKDGKEVDREVHAFESVAEAQKFATMMKLKGWQVKQTVAREYSVNKEGPASKIVRQMHDIIKELGQGQQGLPEVLNLEDQLLDSLNQSFLQALPDMSYAKHFIHAKDVKGASKDALRAFAHSALHGAHHISRIRHADKVTNALMDLDNSINATVEGDTTEARQVYNELVRRHNDIMNPTTHPFSAWLGQLGFTMSLGGVVATGITNATQVPLVTYPWMGARYGFGKASAALARAYRDFLDPRTLNKDSLFDATKSKLISESERKMLLELARRGHIDLTQTMDLAGLSSRDNLSRKARTLGTVGEKVTRMLGFTFHVPEVMNRQVTALSTFRLEKEKGGSFEEALERAQQAIQDTHFIYQCVDTETECMTPTGWKRYDELEVGQTIYGTDESGALIETTIEAVNIHRGEHKVLSMANQDGFTMVVTENHRCVTQLRDSRLKKWLKPRLTEARDLQYFHTLLRSPIGVHLQREAVYEDDFVALLAWVVAEGSYRKTNKSTVTISQSIAHNPARVAEIEDLLKRLGGHYRRYDVFDKRRPDYHGINFVLRRPLSYAVREALPDKMITPELMAKLTVDQMRLFVETFGKGDGYRISGLRITQKDRGTLDMLQVMATITGNTSYISQVKHGRHVWHVLYICSTTKRSYVKCLKPERVVVDTVWCPTTTCGTWIARRGGRTFVTGNSHNRPRYMQGNFLRVLTQFKQYSQNIAYTYGRAASIWLDRNNATKEERTVAKRQLLSMLALQFGAAGALGMPFFGAPLDLLMAVVSAMGDDDDEKRDWEVSLRKWLDGTATSLAEAFIDDKEQAGKVGKELAEVVAHGASRLTPWDMAGRLGQNDLFFREPQREREGRQAVMDWMLSLGGPVPGYGVNFLLGLGDVAKGMTELNAGFFMRGVEELTPAVLRNGVKSLRYTLEGVRTRDEYKQLDLDTSEKLGQLFGFTPARVAEMYESITAVKNKEHRILNEQKALKDRFARAVDDQDDKAKQRILEDIRGFNERNPMFGITSDTLNQSLKARRQHEAGMERGLYLPPRRRALLEEGDWADF